MSSGFHYDQLEKTSDRRKSVTSRVILRRRALKRKSTETRHLRTPSVESFESIGYSEDELSEALEDEISHLYDTEISPFSFYLNKVLLVVPVAINLLFRSIASHDFRAVAIAWGVILPFTSDISVDEAVFPALVATSLGYDNSVVSRNMYISIARSRLGLIALAMLSYYFSDYHILICGIFLRGLVQFVSVIVQKSIPISETTLICGAIVNVLYHIASNPIGSMYEPTAIIASGLIAAVPCYPLLVRFVKNYRQSRGQMRQLPLVLCIYICYFTLAAYLYFGLYGVQLLQMLTIIHKNSDLFAYWGTIFSIGLSVAWLFGNRIGLDGRRKLWHLCTVFMFLPESVRHQELTKVCLAVAIVLFLALELTRATALPPLGVPLHNALQSFIDHRDKRGPLIISHIYLLLGIAVPIFLAESPAGVVCLGLGDTVASQVGRKFGRLRVFGHKSLEGCLGFALATGLALHYFTSCKHIWQIVIPTAFLEAVTPLNDNLVVPMYMLALQGLFSK